MCVAVSRVITSIVILMPIIRQPLYGPHTLFAPYVSNKGYILPVRLKIVTCITAQYSAQSSPHTPGSMDCVNGHYIVRQDWVHVWRVWLVLKVNNI